MASKSKWLTCWVAHRLEMLVHPTWQLAPGPLRRMLERLEVEHLRHGGGNNGELFVAYSQFEEAGISRRSIPHLVTLGTALGLLVMSPKSDDPRGDLRAPNAYRLTYLPAKGGKVPTDEWKSVPGARVKALVEVFRDVERTHTKARLKRAA